MKLLLLENTLIKAQTQALQPNYPQMQDIDITCTKSNQTDQITLAGRAHIPNHIPERKQDIGNVTHALGLADMKTTQQTKLMKVHALD